MSDRPDPYRAFRFRLEIQGVLAAGFQSVSGLERACQIEAYREGGANDFEHQLVTLTSYPPIVLRRGLVDPELWDWHSEVVEGRVERRTISVVLLNDAGNEVWRLVCADAFPSKWVASELEATSNSVATEQIEFVHQGLTKV